ncbi:mitogen-activated kinase 3 [Chlorella sorokiniana]|uniref:Mitogen-activated protein kinase n=1 Tax=Chlorella sorokiniana TaxID=3076 RepID=A0A2P6TLP1_CHLSO|nr:mitogen-activated kinase 3 [Chlorella sorokiniana]|eukprot:PRW45211.1 mitogen-activated kinase 3 [Chlorella sorokiniana]
MSSGSAQNIPVQKECSVPGKALYQVWRTNFEIDTKYQPIKAIGKGAYGVVCSAKHADTGEKVAIKKITNAFENLVDARRTLREMKLLRYLRHENVIAVRDIMRPASQDYNDVYIVYELMDTDLHQIIRSSQPLSDDHFQYFIYQILRGLKYIHSASVLHRDLKPSNLLLNATCDLKICDFGLARTSTENHNFMTEYVVTRWYRAPELLLSCDQYDAGIDVWSVGCILAELLQRKPLFPGKDYIDQLKLIIRTLGTPTDEELTFISAPKARSYVKALTQVERADLSKLFPDANPLAVDLLGRMLQFDPRRRISVEEALAHPWLAQLHDEAAEPSAPGVFKFDFEEQDLDEPAVRKLVWEEMAHYDSAAGGAVKAHLPDDLLARCFAELSLVERHQTLPLTCRQFNRLVNSPQLLRTVEFDSTIDYIMSVDDKPGSYLPPMLTSSLHLLSLPDDLLARCFAELSLVERHQALPLTCRRFSRLVNSPQLLRTVEFDSIISYDSPDMRKTAPDLAWAQSFACWAVRHAAGTAHRLLLNLGASFRSPSGEPNAIWSEALGVLAACGAAGSLQEVQLYVQFCTASLPAWLPVALRGVRRLDLTIKEGMLTVDVPLAAMTALTSLRLEVSAGDLGLFLTPAASLPPTLERLHIGGMNWDDDPPEQLPPQRLAVPGTAWRHDSAQCGRAGLSAAAAACGGTAA